MSSNDYNPLKDTIDSIVTVFLTTLILGLFKEFEDNKKKLFSFINIFDDFIIFSFINIYFLYNAFEGEKIKKILELKGDINFKEENRKIDEEEKKLNDKEKENKELNDEEKEDKELDGKKIEDKEKEKEDKRTQ
ncbi:8464_t:CDS:2 [Dentiscutata erythropus]|uniref:8464_t:CDS:1 n=1 Tax=Dentiscutata erythropus TaxID=1348616 RepID=A0A9N9NAT9_9GLOM|nr:8464_t:CDS:2 [Dentiscutata erythropus]